MDEYNKFAQDILTILQPRLVMERQQRGRAVVLAIGGFKNKTAATELPMLPYHPAAIDFYKSKGIWSGKVAAANAALK